MSSAGTRQRSVPIIGPAKFTNVVNDYTRISDGVLDTGTQITVSESHRRNRKTGSYDGGGPFYTSRVTPFYKDGHVKDAYRTNGPNWYTGPTRTTLPTATEMNAVGYKNVGRSFGDKLESQMTADGTTAISLCNPVNPASNLGTSLAESVREGIPSIPGMQAWRRRTEILKNLGSEYLNYQFGWAPLKDEVLSVVDAARHHANIMKQYRRGEGSDTHRRFDFPLRSDHSTYVTTGYPVLPGSGWYGFNSGPPQRVTSLVREEKRWFEGVFTYALPSSTDSWRRSLGFGSQADQLFGIALSPDVLWELTPWSWAVDWFSNAGEVINNVTNFGLAGLVMRYGYMMVETIEKVTTETSDCNCLSLDKKTKQFVATTASASSSGIECVTKRRIGASPFGFSVGWEGLSPTQLAITAALGITRLL